ncbi:MAG: hypothetical protein E7453_06140 [Ruminococcaceae bacterium]|nr:hypothetical protein [Oscillospiraceae bacterium]
MAARKIEQLTEELEKTKALLASVVEDLQEADVNCSYCFYKEPPAPCAEDDQHYICENCPHDCYCKDCVDNSKWAYKNKGGQANA